MKGSLALMIFFGLFGVVVLGLIAPIVTDIFATVAPEYNSTIQLIIMLMLPVFAIVFLFGIFSGGSTQ